MKLIDIVLRQKVVLVHTKVDAPFRWFHCAKDFGWLPLVRVKPPPLLFITCAAQDCGVGRSLCRLVAFRRSIFVHIGCFESFAVGRLLYSLPGRLLCVDCCGWLLFWWVALCLEL